MANVVELTSCQDLCKTSGAKKGFGCASKHELSEASMNAWQTCFGV